jgi:ABC-2 type transport system permease protein
MMADAITATQPARIEAAAQPARAGIALGLGLTNVLAVLRKELRTYFAFPLVYILSAIFLAISGWFFYTDLVFFVTMAFNQDIIQNYWQLLFVDIGKSCLLLTLPFVTMRLFAEERKLGTIELLYTYPLRDTEIFWGKFLASVAVFTMMLGLTLLYPIYLYTIHHYPILPLIAGYTGLFLLGCSFIAFGIFISSLCESQVVAGVVTIVALLLIWILTWNEAAFEGGLSNLLIAVSIYDHFEKFAKGVIDLYHVVYFISVIAFFSYLTLRAMEARKWTGRR